MAYQADGAVVIAQLKVAFLRDSDDDRFYDGFYNFSDFYRPTNFALNIST